MIRIFVVLVVVLTTGAASAQPTKAVGTATTTTAQGEATVLVPPQGGTADIPVHATDNVVLTFPTPIAKRVLTSGTDWDIKEFDNGVAVRAASSTAVPMTLALATKDGQVKVNITLRVVPVTVDALKLVRFQSASAEDAFQSAVDAEVQRRTVPILAELATVKAELDVQVRARADSMIARRLLERLEQLTLAAHERNDDNVIVHVHRAVFLGPDAYLFFDLENRSSSAYRLAKVAVIGPRKSNHAGPAKLLSSVVDTTDAGVIGVVAAGSTGRAVVLLRQVDALLGAPLSLVVEQPERRGQIVVDRGIILR